MKCSAGASEMLVCWYATSSFRHWQWHALSNGIWAITCCFDLFDAQRAQTKVARLGLFLSPAQTGQVVLLKPHKLLYLDRQTTPLASREEHDNMHCKLDLLCTFALAGIEDLKHHVLNRYKPHQFDRHSNYLTLGSIYHSALLKYRSLLPQ